VALAIAVELLSNFGRHFGGRWERFDDRSDDELAWPMLQTAIKVRDCRRVRERRPSR
jgi:hypothetical protein